MAFAQAGLVKVVTSSTGTNDYVCSDPASQGPYRTDAQAVADGSLANGQEVHYYARDTTVTGDAKFEEGHGVYTSSTRTIARTAANVIDGSSGPGVLVDWGLSGQRDLYLGRPLNGEDVISAATFATNLGLPRLAASNIFTGGSQTIQSSSGEAQLRVKNGNATTTWALRPVGDNSLSIRDVTGATEPINIAGGGSGNINIASGYTLKDASGNPYIAAASGAVLLSESIWTGWTAGYATDNRLIRLAKSGDTLGGEAGTGDPFSSWSTANHALTISEIPSHTHTIFSADSLVTQAPNEISKSLTLNSTGGSDKVSGAAGSGGAHSHTIATPKHRIMVRIVKS